MAIAVYEDDEEPLPLPSTDDELRALIREEVSDVTRELRLWIVGLIVVVLISLFR